MNVTILLEQLKSRMPELQWQLNKIGYALNPTSLPKGLFAAEAEPSAYIREIKKDIENLEQFQHNEKIALHLAQKIKQKIDSLVMLCHYKKNHLPPAPHQSFILDRMSTRQKWMNKMQKEIKILTEQQNSLNCTLKRLSDTLDKQQRLVLQGELVSIENQLSLMLSKYQDLFSKY
jgi:hypothetical protein